MAQREAELISVNVYSTALKYLARVITLQDGLANWQGEGIAWVVLDSVLCTSCSDHVQAFICITCEISLDR